MVDCFDALTSDRPYRPRMSEAEAMQFFKNDEGTMYDPLVVDAFVEMQKHWKVTDVQRVVGKQPILTPEYRS